MGAGADAEAGREAMVGVVCCLPNVSMESMFRFPQVKGRRTSGVDVRVRVRVVWLWAVYRSLRYDTMRGDGLCAQDARDDLS